MKAVVLEVKNKTAAVLREDGVIVTTRQKCAVGETIELKAQIVTFSKTVARSLTAAAAVAILFLSGGLYTYQNLTACSYVSLDFNPSLEWVLNRQNRVLRVEACNEDAESIVRTLTKDKIRNLTVTEALDAACQVLQDEGYVSEDETAYILVNIASDSETRIESLTAQVASVFESQEDEITYVLTDSTVDQRNEARSLGISSGRYQEIQIIEQGPDAEKTAVSQETVSRYEEKTVRDFMEDAGQIAVPKEESEETEVHKEEDGQTGLHKDDAGENSASGKPLDTKEPGGEKEDSPAAAEQPGDERGDLSDSEMKPTQQEAGAGPGGETGTADPGRSSEAEPGGGNQNENGAAGMNEGGQPEDSGHPADSGHSGNSNTGGAEASPSGNEGRMEDQNVGQPGTGGNTGNAGTGGPGNGAAPGAGR